jgi:hypothetical protein
MTRAPAAPVSALGANEQVSVHELVTHDGARVSGILRVPGRHAPAVVSLMHPRQDISHHRLVPELLACGYAVWTQGSRSPNNDLTLVHEQTLLDVAAGQAFLRDQGFAALVTLGHSGGATLYAFYQEQASRAPSDRLRAAPSGLPVDLPGADMPVPDGAIFLAPHPGQGALLQRLIDPSVIDETDVLSVDETLDPYHPGNGFRPAPETSSFSDEFITRYRAAQLARVQRIDEVARQHIEQTRAASTSGDRRGGGLPRVITIYRTDADLRSVDLSLDPNDRPYGSLFGRRPDLANYGLPGFARVTTPEAWLSTWSASSTRACLARNAAGVASAALLVELTGDQACFPADAEDLYGALATADKTHVRVPGLHFGQPLAKGQPSGLSLAAGHIGRWLAKRFPGAG